MENKKTKSTYQEPKMITVLLKYSDVIVTSGIGTGTGSDENWEDNTPPQGWV